MPAMGTPDSPGGGILETVLAAMPVPSLLVDGEVRILHANPAAARLLRRTAVSVVRMKGGDVLRCLNAERSPSGCGTSDTCGSCIVRSSVDLAMRGGRIVRGRAMLEVVDDSRTSPLHLFVSASPFEHEGRPAVLLVLEDIGEIVELRSIIPICASCHKVRDDGDYWQSVESYFTRRLGVDFTHGLCPDCVARLYPDFKGQAG